MINLRKLQKTVLSVTLLTFAGAAAGQDLLSYESFTYDISGGQNLDQRDGGSGWDSPWTVNTGAQVTALNVVEVITPLHAGNVFGGTHALSMPGGGGASSTVAAYRAFDQQLGDVWFSFLLRTPSSIEANDFIQIALNNDSNQSDSGSIGDTDTTATGQKFSVRIGGSSGGNTVTGAGANAAINPSTDYLLVGRLSKDGDEHATNYDLIEMWVNPTDWDAPDAESFIVSAEGDSGFGGADFLTIRTANFSSNTPYTLDELRIGKTYNSVLPEPSGLSLVVLAGAALLRRRRA